MLEILAKITLNSELVETIDKYSIENISSQIRANFSVDTPSFGVIAGSGSLTFKDFNQKFVGYVRQGILTNGIPIDIYLVDTISGKEERIGSWLSYKWNYDVDNDTISVTLKDKIENLQNIEVPNTSTLIPVEDNAISGLDMLNYIKQMTPGDFEFDELDSTISDFLENEVTIELPYLEAGNLWDIYTRFCNFALLFMYTNKEGKIAISKIR